MPSRGNSLRHVLAASLASLWLALSAHAFAAEIDSESAIRESDVGTAIEKLKEDPNLATTREVRTLRWIKDPDQKRKRKANSLRWLSDLFTWFAEVSRVFVWLLIALLVGLLVLYLTRFAKSLQRGRSPEKFTAPTHVRDLDIRPESLPDDIGAAAWALWERGERRSALSLLYRGLLSRLAHVHEVPIRDSSTEGDCLTLAQQHLPAERSSYVAELIRTWQRAVYGGTEPESADIRRLCDQFAAALRAAETGAST